MSSEASAAQRSMRPFLIIWAGQVISIIGSGMTAFGLAVWIFTQTGQATPFALTVLFGSLPRILLAPLAGAAADRWNRKRIMILADSGSALLTVGALLLLSNGALTVWHVYLIAALGSVMAAFQQPAYTASIIMLVPPKQLTRANGLMQMSQALELLVAPMLAGALFGLIGLQGLVFIDFASFFFAVGALLLTAIPQPPRSHQEDNEQAPSIWREAAYGWRFLRARHGLFVLLLYFAAVNFFLNFSAVLLGPLVLAISGAAALGLVQGVGGLGMLAGSIGISAWGGPRHRRVLTVIAFIFVAALGLIVTGSYATIPAVAAGFFILLFTVPFGAGISQTVFQNKTPSGAQGRVFAIRGMISQSMMPLAFLLAGPLADRVFEPLLSMGGALADTAIGGVIGVGPGRGIALLFVLSGMLLVGVSTAALLYRPLRNVEEDLPDVHPTEENSASNNGGDLPDPTAMLPAKPESA